MLEVVLFSAVVVLAFSLSCALQVARTRGAALKEQHEQLKILRKVVMSLPEWDGTMDTTVQSQMDSVDRRGNGHHIRGR